MSPDLQQAIYLIEEEIEKEESENLPPIDLVDQAYISGLRKALALAKSA